ncbi:MarR family winged helix-turn-helix transcriptional regulator [Fictibacillus barbaricus]|uniref:DNA-binding MarR family transcriptional regulator n=1 Tax=Fictibacillus barbaricus TaxID=182136 RepID=A0ABU1U3F8_9BACL|nr:MarR family transcriptional regulator [Fictibacillus barbaricus]MDR7074020.1 DNA-binding MarR family transcriptional regulator [Fictibacillus barbaricus]
MNEKSVETIQFEMATLVRYVTSVSSDKNGKLDRSGYLLLHRLSSQGSTGVKTLANEFHLDISTVSRQAAALEQKGYASRIPDPTDRRAYSYQITDNGKKELAAYKKERMNKVKNLLKGWSEEECEMFGQLLKKFNRSFS